MAKRWQDYLDYDRTVLGWAELPELTKALDAANKQWNKVRRSKKSTSADVVEALAYRRMVENAFNAKKYPRKPGMSYGQYMSEVAKRSLRVGEEGGMYVGSSPAWNESQKKLTQPSRLDIEKKNDDWIKLQIENASLGHDKRYFENLKKLQKLSSQLETPLPTKDVSQLSIPKLVREDQERAVDNQYPTGIGSFSTGESEPTTSSDFDRDKDIFHQIAYGISQLTGQDPSVTYEDPRVSPGFPEREEMMKYLKKGGKVKKKKKSKKKKKR